MSAVSKILELGNSLNIIFSDSSTVLCYPTGGTLYYPIDSSIIDTVEKFGNSLVINFNDGSTATAYQGVGTNFWFVGPNGIGSPSLIDTISPSHGVTNPGHTIASGWQWHLDNNGHRGGVDWNYNFQTFTAPGDGTVTHFDVTGVGMVVRLVLDTPAVRIHPQYSYDQYGPMVAIWFQHCSASVDGHANQGDIIGTSGNGYGAYAPHLHIHGMIDTGSVATSANRCNFWGFV